MNAFARQVMRAAEDTTSIRSYLVPYADAPRVGGDAFKIAQQAHDQAAATIDRTLTRIISLLEESAPELDRAAAYFRRTDVGAAAALDHFLVGSEACPTTAVELELANNPCVYTTFVDSRDVQSCLRPPGPAETPANPLGFMDMISPSHWANEAFSVVFGFDPIGRAQQWLFGDWEAFAAMSPVTTNVGDALAAMAYNVQTGAAVLQDVWAGNAGEGAYRFFTDANDAVFTLRDPLGSLSESYSVMAGAVWSMGEALGGVIKALLDSAIIAGIAAAAGTATAYTGVGPVVGYALAAGEVANMLRLWGKATALYQGMYAAVLFFQGSVIAELVNLDQLKIPDLGGRYTHPAI
ncbi:hypothetical protein [Asanoa iriomotensis]|uniref:hypothetical protein n=1 Tax=Asanoa iriomotensis TaxID=234613 RepID=UPI0019410CEB|nr:hypothetical protein [Asanoa iriomotensis]